MTELDTQNNTLSLDERDLEPVSPPRRRIPVLVPVLLLLLLFALVGFAGFYRMAFEPLDADAAGLRTRVSRLEAAADTERARTEALERERDALRAERDALRSELESTVEERDAQIAALEAARRELEERMHGEIASGDIELSGTGGRFSIGMADQILFPSGSAELSPRGRAILARIAPSLLSIEGRVIQVEGHTDAMPVSAELAERFPTNWELSTARATNVVRYLTDECSVPGERLVASGFSQYRPRASNRTTVGRRRNRRIQLNLLPGPHAEGAEPAP